MMARYIDRDETLGEINRHKFDTDADYEFVWNAITSAETVDVAPVVHGRWIPLWFDEEDKEFGEPPSDYKCSVCSNIVQGRHCGQYCPNCGARMQRGDNE